MSSYERFLIDLTNFAVDEFGSPSRMADNIGFSQPIISNLLTKKTRPRIDTICELLDKIGGGIFIGEHLPPDPDTGQQAPREQASIDEDSLRKEIAYLRKELSEERKNNRELSKNYQDLVNDYRDLQLRTIPRNQDTSAFDNATVEKSDFEIDTPSSEVVQDGSAKKYGD